MKDHLTEKLHNESDEVIVLLNGKILYRKKSAEVETIVVDGESVYEKPTVRPAVDDPGAGDDSGGHTPPPPPPGH